MAAGDGLGLLAGFHDITDLSGTAEPAIARDINESGVIAGQVDGTGTLGGSGMAWECVGGGDVDSVPLGAFAPTSGQPPSSGAFAVNDDADPMIVGISLIAGHCFCGSPAVTKDVNRGFSIRLSVARSDPSDLTELPVGLGRSGEAYDVNTPQGSNDVLIAGHTTCISAQESTCIAMPSTCQPTMEPLLWIPVTPDALTSLDSNGDTPRDLNNNEKTVGWGLEEDDPFECVRRATYWSSPAAAPFNLGNTMPPGQQGDASRAEAINNLALPQVVGWNETTLAALLWEQQTGGSWDVTDLNTEIGLCATNEWLLLQAHDINDDGWIVALAQNHGTNSGLYAVLLTPWPELECPADITGNGCVDTDDLVEVILGWGSCPIGTMCLADVDGNCAVDNDDLVAVILGWECGCPESFGGPSDPPTLEEVITLVLEQSISSETQAEIIAEVIEHWD